MGLFQALWPDRKEQQKRDSARESIARVLDPIWAQDKIPRIPDIGEFEAAASAIWRLTGEHSLSVVLDGSTESPGTLWQLSSLPPVDRLALPKGSATDWFGVQPFGIAQSLVPTDPSSGSTLAYVDSNNTWQLYYETLKTTVESDAFESISPWLRSELSALGEPSFDPWLNAWDNVYFQTVWHATNIVLRRVSYVLRLIYVYNRLGSAPLAIDANAAAVGLECPPHTKYRPLIPQTANNPPPLRLSGI